MQVVKEKRKIAKRKPKDERFTTATYCFRIKDASKKRLLQKFAKTVNFVWNYCNDTSSNAIRNHGKFLSAIDLKNLTSGSAKELGLNSVTVQAICEEYIIRRIQFKKRKLKWRASGGAKKALGWIPFKANSIKVEKDRASYYGQVFRFWRTRQEMGRILSGTFSEDAKGRWYLNLACEVAKLEASPTKVDIGIDLGLKTSAALSDGSVIQNKAEFRALELKLAKAQRAKKKSLVKAIHARIRNKRRDFLHKETTKIAKKYWQIFVGNVSGKFLQSGNGKSSRDASIGIIRDLLKYKAIRHSGYFLEVDEKFSTLTCSNCLQKSGPSGLSDLGVREWICSECGASHDRDTNAAKNILRVGRDSLRAANAA